MKRRTFLTTATATLALPAIARSQSTRVLKFIPHADLTVLDPIWTTAYVTRNHGYLIFDTLYGSTTDLKPEPQMVEGYNVENDGKLWKITLRPGLRFHDGEPVLARDCVASIRRWGRRDTFGQGLMAAADEIAAPDDKTIAFRLKKPFPLLPDALGKPGSNFCAIMPERVAKTDPFTQISEMVGSGPYRWSGSERVVGSLDVYQRFPDYHPRETGQASFTAGPKIANFDRIEWHIIPDPGTASAALQSGEMDWWENPTTDMLPLLQRAGKIKIEVADPSGQIGTLRLNHLHPPFNNPEIRRALLSVTNQQDFMEAVAGDDDTFWTVPVGFFMPGSPMASNVGLDVFKGPRDYDHAKKAIAAAGYKGEKVVLLVGTDVPVLKAEADVAADMITKAGFAVDYQAMTGARWCSAGPRKIRPRRAAGMRSAPSGPDTTRPTRP
jgi:peptide/nickel transport system substrate-binding protein